MDRVAQNVVFDGVSVNGDGWFNGVLALTEHFYDGSTTYKQITGSGRLTLVRTFVDAQLPVVAGQVWSSNDVG